MININSISGTEDKMVKEITTIKTLDSFIKIINSLDENEYFYRGEETNFPAGIVASAYRPQKNKLSKKNIFLDYQTIRADYFREIASELSDVERNNFLGYSQHHGLPTELIDISKNPLVALFFACQNVGITSGYVYIFKDELTINLTNLINRFSNNLDKLSLNNIFLDYQCLDDIYNQLLQHYCNHPEKHGNYYCEILEFLKLNSQISNTDSILQAIKNKIDDIDLNSISLYDLNSSLLRSQEIETAVRFFITDTNNRAKFNNSSMNWNLNGDSNFNSILAHKISFWILFILQRIVQNQTERIIENYQANNNRLINVPLPLFIYKPSMNFERIKSQDGHFIYQLNQKIRYREKYIVGSKNFACYTLVKLPPHKVIRIQNKHKILKELDRLGINRKTLFQDHDNTAQYLVEKNLNKQSLESL